MKRVRKPAAFDGAKFAARFGLDPMDGFREVDGWLEYPDHLPDPGRIDLSGLAPDAPEPDPSAEKQRIRDGTASDADVRKVVRWAIRIGRI